MYGMMALLPLAAVGVFVAQRWYPKWRAVAAEDAEPEYVEDVQPVEETMIDGQMNVLPAVA